MALHFGYGAVEGFHTGLREMDEHVVIFHRPLAKRCKRTSKLGRVGHTDGARCVAAGGAAAPKHPRAHGPARRVEYLLP